MIAVELQGIIWKFSCRNCILSNQFFCGIRLTERPVMTMGSMGEVKKQQHTCDPHLGSRAGAGLVEELKKLLLYNTWHLHNSQQYAANHPGGV